MPSRSRSRTPTSPRPSSVSRASRTSWPAPTRSCTTRARSTPTTCAAPRRPSPATRPPVRRQVIESLISVLDDIAAARAHGDLEDGPFASIANKLEDTLKTRFELERYGAEGDDFDPALHDALMATTSADVDHPVIGQVLASGYRRGERVVRAAKVLVNNPE